MDETEAKLVEFTASFAKDPLGFAQVFYPWGDGELAESKGLRTWQSEVHDTIGKHLRNPETRFQPLLIAIASGHDIGKSAEISMICHWALSTCVDTKIVVTANTETQLRTKTWPEVSKWFRLGLNKHWFKATATSISSVEEGHERAWRADAIAWSSNNTEAFAGLHNMHKRIVLVFDESSAIDDNVWSVAEGALVDENTEIIWLAFGNPTRATGRFRECFGKYKHRWITKQIDSRKVEGTNKAQLERFIEDYGVSSDFVKVRILGEFPNIGEMQFIGSELVEGARAREPHADLQDPFILSCDVARFGSDSTVIVQRRGLDAKSIPWIKMRGADTMVVAAKIAELWHTYKHDIIFVDEGGVGGGVIDRLNMLKVPVIGVNFGGRADRSLNTSDGAVVYANKRAEMWGFMRDWLRHGSIPDDPDLASELVSVDYGYALKDGKDAILLEKKQDMKKRGLPSPDMADALAISFAYPVAKSDHTLQFTNRPVHRVDYNPLGRNYVQSEVKMTSHQIEYNSIPR